MTDRTATAPVLSEAQYERLRFYEGYAAVSLNDRGSMADRNLLSAALLRTDASGNGYRITELGTRALEAFRADHGLT